jgi:hypothetical protein
MLDIATCGTVAGWMPVTISPSRSAARSDKARHSRAASCAVSLSSPVNSACSSLIANDTNVATLGVLLQQNPNGLLVYRDEIVSLLDTLDREEFVSELGFYLTGSAASHLPERNRI